LDAYAASLKAQHLHQNEFVHAMLAKIRELGCGNYGNWRSEQGGNCDHDKNEHRCKQGHKHSCDRDRDDCDKKSQCDRNGKKCQQSSNKCNKR
jgi:hypothetical protein